MNNILDNLSQWLQTPEGNGVFNAFFHEWSLLKNLITGKDFMQIAKTNKSNIFNGKNIILDHDFLGDVNQLPFSNNFFDGIFIPFVHHKLKFINNLCTELERVIKPGGVVVFLGFNVCSFWGMKNLLSGNYSHQSFIVQHKMRQHGFELMLLKDFFSSPPSIVKKILIPAGFYCLVLKKTVESPIKLAYDTVILMP